MKIAFQIKFSFDLFIFARRDAKLIFVNGYDICAQFVQNTLTAGNNFYFYQFSSISYLHFLGETYSHIKNILIFNYMAGK